jgi:glycosyltransferase involved in cell wall biosynthesis
MLRRSQNETNFLGRAYFYQEYRKLLHFEKINCKNAYQNFTCSELDSDRLREIIPESKIKSIPNGVDRSYFNGSPKTLQNISHITFVFAGRLNAYTNKKAAKELACEVWPSLKRAFPGSKCLIVGSSPSKALLDAADIDQDLIVTGYVEDVRPYLRESSIYICPIKDGGGTKLKILDALAMGIPIITHPVACEGISVTNGLNILYATETKHYVENVTKLLSDPELYENISKEGIELIDTDYAYGAIGRRLAENF